jgi:hypothetical protein
MLSIEYISFYKTYPQALEGLCFKECTGSYFRILRFDGSIFHVEHQIAAHKPIKVTYLVESMLNKIGCSTPIDESAYKKICRFYDTYDGFNVGEILKLRPQYCKFAPLKKFRAQIIGRGYNIWWYYTKVLESEYPFSKPIGTKDIYSVIRLFLMFEKI